MKNYYHILEISPTATENEIKKAYRVLAVKYHPDKNEGDEYFIKKFIEIQEAYNILKDPKLKLEYDSHTIHHETSEHNQTNKENETINKEQPFIYKPHKVVFSQKERNANETPQERPHFDFWGMLIEDDLQFFKLPTNIGTIIGAFSDYKVGEEPISTSAKNRKKIKHLIISLVITTTIILIAKLSTTSAIILLVLSTVIAIWTGRFNIKFKKKNYFIGVNGFAFYTAKDRIDNIESCYEINFNQITDVSLEQTEKHYNFRYVGTDFSYTVFNRNTGAIPFIHDNRYFKDAKQNENPIEYYLCNLSEKYWTIYLLDNMEKQLSTEGFITFNLFYTNGNIWAPYVKLGIGEMVFLRNSKEEFTYKYTEIKNIYVKDSKLHVQHLDFQKTLFFLKSGNEDVIPLVNLCNRLFFIKALEILLGYKL